MTRGCKGCWTMPTFAEARYGVIALLDLFEHIGKIE